MSLVLQSSVFFNVRNVVTYSVKHGIESITPQVLANNEIWAVVPCMSDDACNYGRTCLSQKM
jgi:hypothetical protein